MAITPEHGLTAWLGTSLVAAHVNDPGFLRFLNDHINILKASATVAAITPDRVAQSRYSVSGWLLDNGLTSAYAPIFCMLNDIRGDQEFIKLSTVRMLPIDLLTEYWSIYSSTVRDT